MDDLSTTDLIVMPPDDNPRKARSRTKTQKAKARAARPKKPKKRATGLAAFLFGWTGMFD